ncbi:MAG: hypothetical protein IJ094_03595 [Bacilli bacterium]|nr:hypothetical protein [Bacilli bacterium]
MYENTKFKENYKFNFVECSNDYEGLYVADFETSKVNNIDNDVFVYATGLMNVLDNSDICFHNNNIHDFIENISNLPTIESKIYFHNLSFDSVFCLLELFDKGFEQIRNKYKKRSDGGLQFTKGKKTININKEVSKVNKNDDSVYLKRPYSYNIVFNNGSFYRIDLYFDFVTYTDSKKRKKTKLRKVSLLDSYKLVPMSLKKIAKDFLNYEMSKDGIDHTLIREKNYKLKEKEKEYLYEDVKILKDFIKLSVIDGIEVYDNYKIYFNKMTTASQCLNEYKTLIEGLYNNSQYESIKAFKEGFKKALEFSNEQNKKGYKTNIDKDLLFQCVFPQLHPNIDAYLRQSYYGGITWKNEKKLKQLEKDNIQLKGLVYDVNSLYPSVMRTELLPYGEPKYFEGNYINIPEFVRNEYPLYIQRIRVKMFKIKPNKVPCVQIRESFNFSSTEYQENNFYYDEKLKKEVYEECVFTFTNIQLKRFLDSYDTPLGIEYIDGYIFKGSYGIFDEYIDTFMRLKEVGKGAKRATAKLCLNSLYGKFGTNPQREERLIHFDDGIFSTTNKDEDGNLLEYLSESIYLPMASFITSYAREVLLNASNNVYNRFLYCDTDSIHILGYDIPNIPIHDSKLGCWKFEGKFIDAKYIGAKRYAEFIINENNETHWDIKCCGVSSDIIEQLDDINVFNVCEYNGKELNKLLDKFYKKDDIYYYKDKECSQKVIGLLRSKKKKYVKGGILIQEQPYAITSKTYVFRG